MLDAMLAAAGAARPATKKSIEAFESAVDQVTWLMFARIVDMCRIISTSSTISPETIYNIMRLFAMIFAPLANNRRRLTKSESSRIFLGGAETTMPSEFWGEDSGRYHERNLADFTNIGPTPDVIRGALSASPPSNALITGGRKPVFVFTDAAMDALLREYRDRLPQKKVRIGKGGRRIIGRILESNLTLMFKSMSKGTSFSKMASTWKLVM